MAGLRCIVADDRDNARCLSVSEGKKAKWLVSLAGLLYLDLFDHGTGCAGDRPISAARLDAVDRCMVFESTYTKEVET
jgi:hypothetical protein